MTFSKYGWAAVLLCVATAAHAQWFFYQETDTEEIFLSPAKHEQRAQDRQQALPLANGALENAWADGKNALHKIGLTVGADISYTAQRVTPNGKQTAIQGIYYPYLTWNLFKDDTFGQGQLNINYTFIRYWGTQAGVLQNRADQVVAFNDYPNNQEFFSQFSYTHTLGGDLNWLSVTVGQIPLYNFDGTTYLDNQQTALFNDAMAQNASVAYPTASFGAYVQAQNEHFTVAGGYQDATNITGQTIQLDTAFDGKYTVFGSVAWTPKFEMGQGQYSVLYYYQPSVEEQAGHANGWSFNMQQNMGEHWVLFGRANGSTNNITPIKQSYVLGGGFLNPLKRNTQDAILLGVAYNRLSKSALGYPSYVRAQEMAVELQWIWGIGNLITITPDIQFYPQAGFNNNRRMETVLGLRTTIML